MTPAKSTPAKKAAPRKAAAKKAVAEEPQAKAAPKPAVAHFAEGPGCTCGWTPNYDHAMSLGHQQARHLERNRPED